MLPISATALFATTAAFQEMTLEQKVGQIMMVHFHGEEANDDAAFLVRDLGVGGIIYYNWSNGLHSPEQVRRLSAGLQELAPAPLLIAVDQEGGRVTRLKEGFLKLPSAKMVGNDTHPDLAIKLAFQMGTEMVAAGVNTNLAPVVDINSNPDNPVIGDRSFGNTAAMVTAFAEKTLDGYREAGVFTTLKHFPGHGDTEKDSHFALPIISKTKAQLEDLEFVPFRKLAAKADMVMTAHLMVPALDPENCSTLSKPTLDILRAMGAKVIIADSLVMKGVLQQTGGSVIEAAIKAFNAGCDILLFGGKRLEGSEEVELGVRDIRQIHGELVAAVKAGRITEERLSASVERILQLKERKKP